MSVCNTKVEVSLEGRAGIRCHPVLSTENFVDHFGISIGKSEDIGGLVARQTELGNKDEYLDALGIVNVDLPLPRPSRYPRR